VGGTHLFISQIDHHHDGPSLALAYKIIYSPRLLRVRPLGLPVPLHGPPITRGHWHHDVSPLPGQDSRRVPTRTLGEYFSGGHPLSIHLTD
jgi:hypothetical protein